MKITWFGKLFLLSIVSLGVTQKINAMTREREEREAIEERRRFQAWLGELEDRGFIAPRKSMCPKSGACRSCPVLRASPLNSPKSMSPVPGAEFGSGRDGGAERASPRVVREPSPVVVESRITTPLVAKAGQVPVGYGSFPLPLYIRETSHDSCCGVCCTAAAGWCRECADGCASGSWNKNTIAMFPWGWFMCCCLCMDRDGRPIPIKVFLRRCGCEDGDSHTHCGDQVCAYLTCGLGTIITLATLATIKIIN